MGLRQISSIPFSVGGTHGSPTIGHSHFWERAVSRRTLMVGAATAVGVMAGARLVPPRFGIVAGAANGAEPRPIPGGVVVLDQRRYHAYVPGRTNPLDPGSPINEPSTITDFDGVIAITQTQGTGTGIEHGVEAPMSFDADMRFMAGRYVGRDGEVHQGAFGFI